MIAQPVDKLVTPQAQRIVRELGGAFAFGRASFGAESAALECRRRLEAVHYQVRHVVPPEKSESWVVIFR